jgi:hypothetical protein
VYDGRMILPVHGVLDPLEKQLKRSSTAPCRGLDSKPDIVEHCGTHGYAPLDL